MSTVLIVLIVVVVLLVLLALAVVPRMRAQAEERRRRRELEARRSEVAEHHRSEADTRTAEAERAAQQARAQRKEAEVAEHRAQASRAEAELHQERAGLTEEGLRDDEILSGDRDREPARDDRGTRVVEEREIVEERPARADGGRERLFDRDSRERDSRYAQETDEAGAVRDDVADRRR
jgi:flagellar biosynthesis/type III secretory pathway M-ring protein FliF/YscJ